MIIIFSLMTSVERAMLLLNLLQSPNLKGHFGARIDFDLWQKNVKETPLQSNIPLKPIDPNGAKQKVINCYTA